MDTQQDIETVQALVIDCGSGTCKAGFSGEGEPTLVFPSIIGRPKDGSNFGNKDYRVGNKVITTLNEPMRICYPIENGSVKNWDDMQLIFQHVFDCLKLSDAEIQELRILVSEPSDISNPDQQMTEQLMFETFKVKELSMVPQSVLALYGCGQTSGMTVSVGDDLTQIVPIYEGYAVRKGERKNLLAGRELTQQLIRLLKRKGVSLTTAIEEDYARQMKEKYCFVALDYDRELAASTCDKFLNRKITLPDGHVLELNTERYQCTECLFNPLMCGKELDSLPKLIVDAIQSCDIDLRSGLYENIVVTGGSTMFPGFINRLNKELQNILQARASVKMYAPPSRKCGVWLGGSVLASLSVKNETLWKTRVSYIEK